MDSLAYHAPGYPAVPIIAIIMCLFALVLVVADPSQRSTLLYMIPFVALCYGVYYLRARLTRGSDRHDEENIPDVV